MKPNYLPLLAIFLIGLVFITGCVAQESSTKKLPTTTPPAETPKTTPPETPAPATTPPPETPKMTPLPETPTPAPATTPSPEPSKTIPLPETPAPLPTETTLKALAKERGTRFGALYNYDRRGSRHDEIFETEMNVMTVGTFLTDGSHKSPTEFDFSEMDEKVNWGLTRNMELHGHILVWYNDLADWVKAAPNANVEDIMNKRIDMLVKRYAGKIKVWDVVNEAVNDNGSPEWGDDGPAGTLRMKNKWAEAMETDYIRKAFVRAHAADPNAVLRYNDYNIESNKAKFEGVKNLLINLKKQGAPVHALGWQMHIMPENFDAATLLARMNEIADLGFDNYITELDVELPENPAAADYEKQKQTYKGIVETFLKARRHKTIVVWGIHDGDPGWLTNNHPLLFDENFKKKPAYFGVQEALQ